MLPTCGLQVEGGGGLLERSDREEPRIFIYISLTLRFARSICFRRASRAAEARLLCDCAASLISARRPFI